MTSRKAENARGQLLNNPEAEVKYQTTSHPGPYVARHPHQCRFGPQPTEQPWAAVDAGETQQTQRTGVIHSIYC